ncbi:Fructosamine kinase-domain-containing protein [Syncephalis pseudoplumigaleata]|uniref:protein-ribulosamine 3-kinase n=1 Tax=Syncephalis pseudoplumigaleata TaxID=1712513 RepID=A0A4V1J0Z6_9FUNG|nr:Fructosamine kinase-domain-containing protein [Syncephalis pseudoplumigaleata]RKP24975.1 Fructosamine kinase-domain-containing protein [Syncephalis pseudoplumigaleata]|eukprot:RKP23289.1 Fructosamine kinase-domain-containing protein [Syncephalis pseudoplumigaleata]
MFQAEYLSLALINQIVAGFAPHPMFYGVLDDDDDDSAYLVTEFVPISGQQDAAAHASTPMHACVDQLALTRDGSLHKTSAMPSYAADDPWLAQIDGLALADFATSNKGHSRGCYGFPCTTYCGATPQANTPCPDGWSVFWRDKRLRPLLATLEHDQELNRLGHELMAMVPQIIGDDTLITPSLIHGDLWSGNWGIRADTGEAVIFDPAMYFGHHEAEFGIINMFGGLYNGARAMTRCIGIVR